MIDNYLEQLTDSQQKAVLHKDGPLLVLAGPGSGKTRVITFRIAQLIANGVYPSKICAITFTNKAAQEMRDRVLALGVPPGAHISTFHSLCVRILRQFAIQAGLDIHFSIFDAADQRRCIKQAVKACQLDAGHFSPAKMLSAISALKNRLIDPDTLESRSDDYFSKMLVKVYRQYQQILLENHALDFDDLLMETALLLHRKPDICDILSDRFRYVLIDEYQDTNHAQYRIAQLLVRSHSNICATGDPDQSIYRWRGANIENILAFEKDWPDAIVVKLEENFRSTPNILELADRLIANNRGRKAKTLIATCPRGSDVVIQPYEDEAAEAKGIAEKIQAIIADKENAGQIAIFYRVNAMSRVLEEALIRHQVPYQIVRGVEFYNRKEIRDMLAYLKVLVNPADTVSLMRIINTPTRGIGKTTIERIQAFADLKQISFYQAIRNIQQISTLSAGAKSKVATFDKLMNQCREKIGGSVAECIECVFEQTGMKADLRLQGADGKDAIDNIEELINAAALYDKQTDSPDLTDWLQQIALFSDVDTYDASSQSVALMTLHCAKGLEFEHVFIVGLEDGLLPHERSVDEDDELEEERRLFFVGMTRAKHNLHISYTRYRTIRGRLMRTIPSPFLFELGVNLGGSQVLDESNDDGLIYEDTFDDLPVEQPYTKGQLVQHKKFGIGIVENFIEMGENSVVTVRFKAGQSKSLMTKFANLVKIQDVQ